MAIKSHDLAIHVPAKAHNSEVIVDGGELSPLTVEEQIIILKALLKSSREYQLMFYLALFTGARLQTICTLRICHLPDKKLIVIALSICQLDRVQVLILNFKSR